MSYDFDTALTPCDHMVLKERMSFDVDCQTLVYYYNNSYYMRGVINGEDSVKVYVGGSQVPRNHPKWGWRIIPDPLTREATFQEKRKRIQFLAPQRLTDVVVEIDYRTIAAHCNKCAGSSRTHDLKLSSTNGFLHIKDTSKLMSRVSKFLLTSECEFYPGLTCPLRDWIGDKMSNGMIEEDVSLAINASLSNLKRIQMVQKNIQDLSPQEILRDVEGVSVVQSPDDDCKLIATVAILSYGSPESTPLRFSMRNS